MSKEIFLYSEDKKYKCAVELADSLDKFNCPDHSVMILFEERDNGTYIIAQAKDKLLETDKDKKIADLEAKLAEKDRAIENWQTMYESVVQTCHNDKEEIERLNKQLETQENTITNLVEDNRASQEWYKKQLAETEAQNKRVLEKLDFIVKSNQELEKQHDIDTQVIELMEDNRNKDKISFAVEQLEKVKEFANNEKSYDFMTEIVYLDELLKQIDNQIKQLKEMK